MKKYGIKVHYQTGDSFSSHEVESFIEFEWDNLDSAKESLKRIKEHYLWYDDKNDSYKFSPKSVPEPDWHKGMEYEFVLKLVTDSGEDYQFSAYWCGYFESLYSAEIVELHDSSLRVYFH